MKVVYGHTDSIYVQIDTVEQALDKIKVIEDEVRKSFPNVLGLEQHPVVLEFEKFYSALGVGTTKNRNAGLITWDDGEYLETPKFTMTGFTAKRVSETKLAKDVQTEILKMWVRGKSQEEIVARTNLIYDGVLKGDITIDRIAKKSRMRKPRFMVRCPKCSKHFDMREGIPEDSHMHKYQPKDSDEIKWCDTPSNEFTGIEKNNKKQWKRVSVASGVGGILHAMQKEGKKFDDSYVFVKVKDDLSFEHPLTKEEKATEYAAGINYEELERYTPDYAHYAEQVVKKAEPVFKAMGWDTMAIKSGKIQKTLTDWW